MSTEDLIAMAKESGFARSTHRIGLDGKAALRLAFDESKLEAFAKLIEARTREECAALCDAIPAPPSCNTLERSLWDIATMACADAIRIDGLKPNTAEIRAMGDRT